MHAEGLPSGQEGCRSGGWGVPLTRKPILAAPSAAQARLPPPQCLGMTSSPALHPAPALHRPVWAGTLAPGAAETAAAAAACLSMWGAIAQ
jgi:hypothetical protein